MIKTGKFWIVSICMLLTATLVNAQSTEANIHFEEMVHDFGTIKEANGAVEHSFTFSNTGGVPLVVTQAVASCGCTTSEYTKKPVMPNKTGTVKVIFDPAGRPGAFRKQVTLRSSGKTNRTILTLTGNVVAAPRPIEADFPIDLGNGLLAREAQIAFGYVPRGGEKTMVIEIYNNSDKTINIGTVNEKNSPYFQLKSSADQLAPQQRCLINATYNLSQSDLWGMLSNPFRVTINGQPCATQLSAAAIAVEDFSALTAQQQANVAAAALNSQYFHAGEVKAGEAVSRKFTLTNEGKSPLIVRHIGTGHGISSTLKLGTSLRPGESLTFTVTLHTPNQSNQKALGNLTLIFNDPRRPMREIRVAANTL